MWGHPPCPLLLPFLYLLLHHLLSGGGPVVPLVAADDDVSLIQIVEYAVEYQTVRPQQNCSEHYAQKFLANFVNGHDKLTKFCKDGCGDPKLSVNIAKTLTYYSKKTGEMFCFDENVNTAFHEVFHQGICIEDLTTTQLPTTTEPTTPTTEHLTTPSTTMIITKTFREDDDEMTEPVTTPQLTTEATSTEQLTTEATTTERLTTQQLTTEATSTEQPTTEATTTEPELTTEESTTEQMTTTTTTLRTPTTCIMWFNGCKKINTRRPRTRTLLAAVGVVGPSPRSGPSPVAGTKRRRKKRATGQDAGFKFMIRFTGDIKITGSSGGYTTHSAIECCSLLLNGSVFDEDNILPAIRVLPGAGACGEATITAAGVQRTTDSWTCSHNDYSYNDLQQKCVTKPQGGPPSGTTGCNNPSPACNQSCVAEVICKVGSTMFCRRANECYQNLSGRFVPNICIEELQRITSIGDIKCNIFPTPTTESSETSAAPAETTPLTPSIAHFDLKVLQPKGETMPTMRMKEGEERNVSFVVTTNNPDICDIKSVPSAPCTNLFVDLMFSPLSQKIKCRRTGELIQQVVVGSWYSENTGLKNDASCKIKMNVTLDDTITVTVKAVQDFKYDGLQDQLMMVQLRLVDGTAIESEIKATIKIRVEDRDLDDSRTCSSINDPHITTFDKLNYDNFFQGEFILYQNIKKQTQVNIVYQNCSENVQASCNCAVAIRAHDDIFIVHRCKGTADVPFVPVGTTLKVSNKLTPGMRVIPALDGAEYTVFLPGGTHVSVLLDNELINVWVTASLSDEQEAEGLCGNYNLDCKDDVWVKDTDQTAEIKYDCENPNSYTPKQYADESISWRVEIGGPLSLFGKFEGPCDFPPRPNYCICDENGNEKCHEDAYANVCDIADDSICDSKTGCDQYNEQVKTSCNTRRKKRQTNTINANDNFNVNTGYKPPDNFVWPDKWNRTKARQTCSDYLENSSEAIKCKKLVNFEPYIQGCVADIRITGGETWKKTAKEAMVQECFRKLNNNPNETDIGICPKECQHQGECLPSGDCKCTPKYTGKYCQTKAGEEPTLVYLNNEGHCDTSTADCQNVIVYGSDFIQSPKLKCRLFNVSYECNENPDTGCPVYRIVVDKNRYEDIKGRFLNFNAVLCHLEQLRSCSISVSNDGVKFSAGKLFLPFNSHCQMCHVGNSSCISSIDQMKKYCLHMHECYGKGDNHPETNCRQCRAKPDGTLRWDSVQSEECQNFRLPDWGVALVAAGAGALIGILFGFLLYMCCCKCPFFERKSNRDSEFVMSMRDPDAEAVFPVNPNPIIYRDQDLARYDHGDDLDVRPVTYPNHVSPYRRRTSPADDEDYDNYF